MRTIKVNEREFELFLWPAIAYQPVENGGEIDAHVRILGKVKAESYVKEEHVGADVPGRRLYGDTVTLILEEDEWGRMKKAVTTWFPKIAGGILDEFKIFQDGLTGTEQWDAKEPLKNDEVAADDA